MKGFLTMFVTLVLLIAGVAVFVWSGRYNVSAMVPHWDITSEILEQVRDRSILAHSKGIFAPSLEAPEFAVEGFKHYHATCRLCHGAPGYSPSEFASGLYPSPPNLTLGHEQEEWSSAALYWIIKNGLKMTGMPAFGKTHSEDEIWGIVAFLNRLPNLKPQKYEAMVEASGLRQKGGEDHHHGDGSHNHNDDDRS